MFTSKSEMERTQCQGGVVSEANEGRSRRGKLVWSGEGAKKGSSDDAKERATASRVDVA